MSGVGRSPQPSAVKLAKVYFLLVEQRFSNNTALMGAIAAASRMLAASLPSGRSVGCRVFITHKISSGRRRD